jgi:hypothetical protein
VQPGELATVFAPGAHKCCTASGRARSVLLAKCRNRYQASGTSCHDPIMMPSLVRFFEPTSDSLLVSALTRSDSRRDS